MWVGHYKGNPVQWFVVWAKNEHEAFLQIDPVTGEPDMGSLKELSAPGFVDFAVDLEGDTVNTRPPAKEDGGWMMVFGGCLGQSDDVEEYIRESLSKKGNDDSARDRDPSGRIQRT